MCTSAVVPLPSERDLVLIMANREERRHGESHQVQREVPVLLFLNADGVQEVITMDDESCQTCRCCIIFSRDLQFVRDSIVKHENERHGKAFRKLDDCPICLIGSGGIDNGVQNGGH